MKIIRLTGGIILLVFLFFSCVKEVSYYDEEIPKGAFVMKNNSPQRVSDRMILEIVEISDQRCPVGIVCSTPGQVKLDFKAYVNGEFVNFGVEFEKMNINCSTSFEGHVIHILEVNPLLYDGDSEIDPNDYNIKIQVDKL